MARDALEKALEVEETPDQMLQSPAAQVPQAYRAVQARHERMESYRLSTRRFFCCSSTSSIVSIPSDPITLSLRPSNHSAL